MIFAEKINAILRKAKIPLMEVDINGYLSDEISLEDDIAFSDETRFKIVEQHNCCGIAVLTDAYSTTLVKRQAIFEMAEVIAFDLGFSMALYTGVDYKLRRACQRQGWKIVEEFMNRNTDNRIFVATKVLV
jgi:hypothetical protein